MNRTLKSLVLGLTLLSPASVFAAPPDASNNPAEHRGHHRGFHMFRKIEAHATELGIAPATIDKMKAAFEAARPDLERLRQDVHQARQSDDEAKIAAAETALKTRHQALRAQIDGLLTDQQKAAIKGMMERHRQEHRQKAGE